MKSVIVFSSMSGFTKKYAEWIAADLNGDIFNVKDITIEKLLYYDTIIYGGSIHAAGITGIKLIMNNLNKLVNKNIVIFATGAAPYSDNFIDEIKKKNFGSEDKKHLKFFYLRGGFDFSKLDLFNKTLMLLFKWSILLKPKTKRTSDEIGMLAAYSHPVDFTKRKNIKIIVDYVNNEKH